MNKRNGNDNESGMSEGKFKGTCFHCDKVGHKKKNCWERNENESERPDWHKKGADESGAATVERLCVNVDESELKTNESKSMHESANVNDIKNKNESKDINESKDMNESKCENEEHINFNGVNEKHIKADEAKKIYHSQWRD